MYELKHLFGDQRPDWQVVRGGSDVTKTLWNMWDDLVLKNNVLYRRYKRPDETAEYIHLVTPCELRIELTELAHTGMTGGHLGVARTKEQVRHRAYWPGWSKFVKRYCESCQPCAKYRRSKPPRQDRPEYTNCAKEGEMAPTKGSYACKECGKMTMGADAHHHHQRRCRSKKMKGNSTVVINTEVVASETPASEVAYMRYDGSDGGVRFCGNILTTQDSSEDQQSKENLMILSSGVWFDPRDLNLQKIQTDGASIVDISSGSKCRLVPY